MEKYTLTNEIKADLFAIRAKVEIEQNPAFFTQNDRAVMAAAYNELTGKRPCWNCSGFMSKIRLSLTNYFKWYDHNEMEQVQIDERELQPVKGIVKLMEEGEVKDATKEDSDSVENALAEFVTFDRDDLEDTSQIFNLNALTLAELRVLYPNIKSNSKSKFIQKIKEDEQ